MCMVSFVVKFYIVSKLHGVLSMVIKTIKRHVQAKKIDGRSICSNYETKKNKELSQISCAN
jgi:hypothetical protein